MRNLERIQFCNKLFMIGSEFVLSYKEPNVRAVD